MAAKKSGLKKSGYNRKKKGIKYRKLGFKLTTGQKKALDHYCKTNNITPIRFIKSLVNDHVSRYREQSPRQSYVTKNQLTLFDQD